MKFIRWLMLTVFLAVSLCFAVKLLAFYNIIPWPLGYNDVMPWAKKIFQPGLPYIDKPIEYPVIIGLLGHTAAQTGFIGYQILHYLIFLGSALLATYYLYLLAVERNLPLKRLYWFWALAPSMLWFSYFNWDIITVMFSVLALYLYTKNKDVLATVFLALGFATKMYPILFAFPFLLQRKKIVTWIKVGATFAITFLAINLYFMLTKFMNWYFIYGFHGNRDPNPDSIWALIMQLIPNLPVKAVNIITLLSFAALYLFLTLKFRKKDPLWLCFVSLLLFLIINKVLSPQFLLWLLPFYVLFGIDKKLFYGIEISNVLVLLTTLLSVLPEILSQPAGVWSGIFVVIRHILLLILLFTVLRRPAVSVSS